MKYARLGLSLLGSGVFLMGIITSFPGLPQQITPAPDGTGTCI